MTWRVQKTDVCHVVVWNKGSTFDGMKGSEDRCLPFGWVEDRKNIRWFEVRNSEDRHWSVVWKNGRLVHSIVWSQHHCLKLWTKTRITLYTIHKDNSSGCQWILVCVWRNRIQNLNMATLNPFLCKMKGHRMMRIWANIRKEWLRLIFQLFLHGTEDWSQLPRLLWAW
jgi:hypothetical protein